MLQTFIPLTCNQQNALRLRLFERCIWKSRYFCFKLSFILIFQMQQMVNSDSRYGGHPQVDTFRHRVQSGMVPQGQLTTINQSQLNTQLGLNNNNGTHGSPSPPESKSATPSPSSSVHEDDADDAAKVRERESVFYPFCDLMNIKAYLRHTHTHGHIDYFMHCGKTECIKRNESLLTFQQVVLPCFLKHRFAKTLICLKSLLHSQNTVHFLQNSQQYWSSGKCDRLYALLRYFCVLFSNTEDTVQH